MRCLLLGKDQDMKKRERERGINDEKEEREEGEVGGRWWKR